MEKGRCFHFAFHSHSSSLLSAGDKLISLMLSVLLVMVIGK